MKRTIITVSAVCCLLLASIVVAQQCFTPGTFVGGYNGAIYGEPTPVGAQGRGTPRQFPTLIASYDTFRNVTDLSGGLPEVAGHVVIGLLAAQDGTLRILDATAVEVDIPLQAGLITRIAPQDILPGGTLTSVIVVYRRV
jgi:hypothetical protein